MKFSIFNFQFSKKLVWIIIFAIIVLAGVLRFWQLGKTPNGLDWDEVALGYNAYSIFHTGKDEYGTFLPIVLKSFGDYKPALYAYIDIPFVALFRLTPFAVRFPSALFGVFTVLLIYFLVEELFRKKSLALLSSFLLAISPWHIQFSRVAFETNIGLFFNALGAFLFLKAIKKPCLLPLAAITFSLNLYVYQSEKIFTPLLILLLIVVYFREIIKVPKRILILTMIVGIFVALPMSMYTLTSPNGIARAQGVSIFSDQKLNQQITRRYEYNKTSGDKLGLVLDNKRFEYIKDIVGNYFSHFNLNWLFITGDISRHHAPDMGLLYLWELPFVATGVYLLLFGKYDKKSKLFLFGWILLAPIPASITQDVPHAVRTMNMVVVVEIFSALGLLGTLEFLKKRKVFLGACVGIFVIVVGYNFLYYLDQYFVQQNYFTALDWQYGYQQIVASTNTLEKSYQHVVIDSENQFSQSYMFYLFYGNVDPAFYQLSNNQNSSGVRQFGKYTFRPIVWQKDMDATNTLFVGSSSDFPSDIRSVKDIIYGVDGKALATLVGK